MRRVYEPPALPPRPPDGHKGSFGTVLVVGGSAGMLGAPVFAGLAALRTGAGLVRVALPRGMIPAALTIAPELIASPLQTARLPSDADAAVVGPGMGTAPAAWAVVDALLRRSAPLVVDADALNLLAKRRRLPAGWTAGAILTPHPGEMRRLLPLLAPEERDVPRDERGRVRLAQSAAARCGQVIVLKGAGTVVCDGHRVYVNRSGDSTLAKAGAGDVLAGMIAALAAQGMERFDAACLGVYLHGRAGEEAGRRVGRRSALARDLLDAIAPAIARDEARGADLPSAGDATGA